MSSRWRERTVANQRRGVVTVFVVVEGPDGVGKSTVVSALAELFALRTQHEVLVTTEPTGSGLGVLLRNAGGDVVGRGLALAIAADRWMHLENEILPALERGVVVISNRYVQSSLVLQRIDGLSLDDIWRYNDFAMAPDLSVYLEQESAVVADRLASRATKSRMEVASTPQQQANYYRDAEVFLEARGWRQLRIECRDRSPEELAGLILDAVDGIHADAYK